MTIIRFFLRRLSNNSVQKSPLQPISVTFANLYGDRVTVPCEVGDNLLEAARKNDIPIDGACGGGGDTVENFGEGAQCTFCHVDIANEFLDRIPKADWRESDLLEEVVDRKQNTRLACQIRLTADLDGMSVAVPEYEDSDIP